MLARMLVARLKNIINEALILAILKIAQKVLYFEIAERNYLLIEVVAMDSRMWFPPWDPTGRFINFRIFTSSFIV